MEEGWNSDPGSDLEEFMPSEDGSVEGVSEENEEYEPEEDPEWVGGRMEDQVSAATARCPGLGEGQHIAQVPVVVLTFPRPQNLGPAPSRGEGQYSLSISPSAEEKTMLESCYAAVVPRIQDGLEVIADRVAVRRRRLGWWPRAGAMERRSRDLRALWGSIRPFRYAPTAMLVTAVDWAVLRQRHPLDEPLEAWTGEVVSLGIILAELHAAEERLLTPP